MKRARISFSYAGMAFYLFPCFFFPNSEIFSGFILLEKGIGTRWPTVLPSSLTHSEILSFHEKTWWQAELFGSFFFFNINPHQSLLTQFQYTHSHMLVVGRFCSPFALLSHPGYFYCPHQKSYLEITFASLNLSSGTWKQLLRVIIFPFLSFAYITCYLQTFTNC